MSELMERALVVLYKVLNELAPAQDLKTVSLCLLMYPSDESKEIIEVVKGV